MPANSQTQTTLLRPSAMWPTGSIKGPAFSYALPALLDRHMIDRFIVMLVPLLVLLIPLAKVLPPLYRWRISSRIYRWYESLHEVDDKIHGITLNDEERVALHTELSRIENEVNKVKTPLSYAEKVYHLLAHINLVRNKLKN